MKRIVQLILLALAALLLSSTRPAPAQIQLPLAVVQLAPPAPLVVQECTYQNAQTRFREVVYDGRGYPYGEVSAWSCLSPQLALDEFAQRKAAMQAEALAKYPGGDQ